MLYFACCSIFHVASEEFWYAPSFAHFTLGVLSAVAMPTNICSANPQNLQTDTNIYKVFTPIFAKIL